jgi:hypothetical protein
VNSRDVIEQDAHNITARHFIMLEGTIKRRHG